MKKEKALNIMIPEELHKEFRMLALHKDTTMKEIMIKCIKKEVEKFKKSKK